MEPGEAVNEGTKFVKENFVKSDSCRYCGEFGSKNKMKDHVDVVKRKGYEKKEK